MKFLALALLMISLSFAQMAVIEDIQPIDKTATTLKAVALTDEPIFELQYDTAATLTKTSLSPTLAAYSLNDTPIATRQVLNPIIYKNGTPYIVCDELLTCDYRLKITAQIGLQLTAKDIAGGVVFGSATIDKVFYARNITVFDQVPIYNLTKVMVPLDNKTQIEQEQRTITGYQSVPRIQPIEETDLSTLKLDTGQSQEFVIRFRKAKITDEADIYDKFAGIENKELAIWGTSWPYTQIANITWRPTASTGINGSAGIVPVLVSIDTTNATLFNSSICAGNIRFADVNDTVAYLYRIDSGCISASQKFWVIVQNLTNATQIKAFAGNIGASSGDNASAWASVPGLTSRWGMETTLDDLGNFNLAATGSQTQNSTTNCIAGGCTNFSASSYLINSSSTVPSDNVSMSCWIAKSADWVDVQAALGIGSTVNTANFMGLNHNSGNLYTYIGGSDAGMPKLAINNADKLLSYYAFGGKADALFVRRNNTFVSTTGNTNLNLQNNGIYIGRWADGGWSPLTSSGTSAVDECRFFKDVKNQTYFTAEYGATYTFGTTWNLSSTAQSHTPTITPTTAYVNSTLFFNVSYAGDASVNATSVNWTIYQNGTAWMTGTSTGNFTTAGGSYSLANFTGFTTGSTLIFGVVSTLSNGSILNQTNSSPVSILNSNPLIASLSFTANGSAFVLGPVQGNATVSDLDANDTITLYWNWFKNGANQTSLNGSHVVANNTPYAITPATSPFSIGDNWSIRVWASDGSATSALNDSANTTIQNYTSALALNYSSPQFDIYTYQHQLNLTLAGAANLTAMLELDNQNLTATQSNVSNAFVFNVLARPAQVSVITNKIAIWHFSAILANGSSYMQNQTYNFSAQPSGLVVCNATQNTTAVNYSILDLENNAPVSASFSSTYNTSTVSRSTSGTASSTYRWCIYPDNASITATFSEAYSATGYASSILQRTLSLSNVSQSITIFLANSTAAKPTQLRVVLAPSLPAPNATITVESFAAPANYTLVQTCTTDATGSCVVSLIPNTVQYRFNITVSGATTTFGLEYIACSTSASLCFRTFTIGTSGVVNYFNQPISGHCLFDNSTSLLTCSSNDTTGTINYGNLSLYEAAANTAAVLLCNQTYAGSAGTLVCTVPVSRSDYYFLFWALSSSNNTYYLDSGWIRDRAPTSQAFGMEGLVIAAIIMICIAAVGFYSLTIAIILEDFALLTMQLLGLVNFGWEIVIGFWLISAMLIYRLRM